MGGRGTRGTTRANRATGDRMNVTVERDARANEAMRRLYGRVLTDAELARLATAGDGAKVKVEVSEKGDVIVLSAVHADYKTYRAMHKDHINNLSFFFEEGKTGTGRGTKLFRAQVKQAAKLGFKTIKTHAERGDDMNGYYTWARLGYNAKLSSLQKPAVRRKIQASFPKAKTIGDLMKTQKGRDFWKEHGTDFHGTFDLASGSKSRRRLDAYAKQKHKKS